MQEFLFTKRAPVQGIANIALLGITFFSNGFNSVNTIFECSYFSFG